MATLAPNTVLKGSWIIEKKLGEGACAIVYSVQPTAANTSSRDIGYVAKVVQAPTGKGAVLKQRTVLYNLLYHEYMLHTGHFKGFGLSPQFPLLPRFIYGEEETTNLGKVRFLVMQRLNADLPAYIEGLTAAPSRGQRSKGKGKVTDTTASLHNVVSKLGVQMMAGLQEVHEKGFVFVDVKPGNFMVNAGTPAPETPRLFFIDFALAERYTAATMGSSHRPNLPCAVPKGTPGFMSVAVQEGGQPSRRDDVEAAVWVLLSLLLPHQELPWATAASPQECLRLKKACDIAALCREHDCSELATLLEQVRAVGYEGVPPYGQCRTLLQALGRNRCGASPVAKRAESPKKPRSVSGKTRAPVAVTDPVPAVATKPRGRRAVAAIDVVDLSESESPRAPSPARSRAGGKATGGNVAALRRKKADADSVGTSMSSASEPLKRRRSVEAPFQML